jgi:chaperonin cofactor prefoldin
MLLFLHQNQTLELILKKVSNLENSWKLIDDRVKKLEKGIKAAPQKNRKHHG